MSERRAFPRLPVALTCQTKATSGSFPGVIREITENGLALESSYDSRVGEEFTVAWLEESSIEPLRVGCVVRNVSPERTGVEFLNVTMKDRLRIARLVDASRTKTSS
jgi:hypothetical protein